jgi:hypothetical protein
MTLRFRGQMAKSKEQRSVDKLEELPELSSDTHQFYRKTASIRVKNGVRGTFLTKS